MRFEISVKDTLPCEPRPFFRIRFGFSAFSDPDFYLSVDPDPEQGSQINADPDSKHCQFAVTKSWIFT